MNVQWLTEEEQKDLAGSVGYASVHPAMDVSSVTKPYEALAACRALLEKHQWAGTDEGGYEECPECKCTLIRRHKPDCAIATALKGVGGEEKNR